MRRHQGLTILIMCCCLALLSGCWDVVELNKRAIVSGIGVDWKEEEKEYLVSFQTVIADEISGKAGRGATPISVYKASGKSVVEAMRNASRKVPRIISLAHTGLIIISDRVAREGIIDLFDYLDRDSDIRLNAEVLISTQGQTAEDVVSALTPIGKITAFALEQKIDLTSGQLGENFRIEVDDVIRGLLTPGGGPVVNGVMIEGSAENASKMETLKNAKAEGLAVISQMAVFKGDRLVSWLNADESRGTVWIRNKMKITPIHLKLPDQDGEISLEVMRSKTRLRADLQDPANPIIHIHVEPNFSIREVNSAIDLRNPATMKLLEDAASKEIIRIMELAVRKSKEVNSDILGFGQAVERSDPSAWRKMKNRWDQRFPRVQVKYHVRPVIRNSQMRDRSVLYKIRNQ